MRIIDMHSHILPEMDDGAKNVEVSIELLKMLKEDGVTDVLATPHFIAQENSLEGFFERREESYKKLLEATKGMDLPNVYLGGEIYYFRGMGYSTEMSKFSLGGSKYILIELSNYPIDKQVFVDLKNLTINSGLVPIIAHIERYTKVKGFKDLLKYINENECYAQVNASSFLKKSIFRKSVKKLVNGGYITFIGTDTHSTEFRPPLMGEGLKALKKDFGEDVYNVFLRNMNTFVIKSGVSEKNEDI